MPIGFKRFGKLSRQPTVLAGVAVLAITVLLAVVILALISGPALKSPSSPPPAKPSFTKPVPLTSPPTPKPAPPPVSTAKTLFFDALGGPDRLLTNEYAHWNPGSDCPYVSSAWDMTSGSLFIKNGAGYSGPPTANTEVPCDSTNSPNSAVFRLTTKANNFTNTITSMDFMMQRHGGEPSNSYDGVHIWVRYQSQDALYAVSVSRWDGVIVIKKKVPLNIAQCDDPSNDGCYYDLTPEVKRPDLAAGGVWHHADVSAVDSGGLVRITLTLDGKPVLDATDAGQYGPAYHSGAVGVRGDNTEFYFKNFSVKAV